VTAISKIFDRPLMAGQRRSQLAAKLTSEAVGQGFNEDGNLLGRLAFR
jgi:hypothetical protein